MAAAPDAGRDHEGLRRDPQQSAEGAVPGDRESREGEDPVSRRQQLYGRLEEGRAHRPVRLRLALHRLSGAQSERRQLLRLPSAQPGGNQLRHHRPEPARLRQAARLQGERDQGRVREDLRLARVLPLLADAAFRRQQGSQHGSDQGSGGAADGQGQPRQQVIARHGPSRTSEHFVRSGPAGADVFIGTRRSLIKLSSRFHPQPARSGVGSPRSERRTSDHGHQPATSARRARHFRHGPRRNAARRRTRQP